MGQPTKDKVSLNLSNSSVSEDINLKGKSEENRRLSSGFKSGLLHYIKNR